MPMPGRLMPRIADAAFGKALRASQLATLRWVGCYIPLTQTPDTETGGWDEINDSPRNEALSAAKPMVVVYRVINVPARVRWDDEQDTDAAPPTGGIKEGQATLFVDRGYASFITATQGDELGYLLIDGMTMKVTIGPITQGFSTEGEISFVCVQYSLTGVMSGDGAGGLG